MSIGAAEVVVVLVVALLVLGPARLPEAARSVGRALGEFRRVTSSLESEVRDAFAEPAPSYRSATDEPPSRLPAGTSPASPGADAQEAEAASGDEPDTPSLS